MTSLQESLKKWLLDHRIDGIVDKNFFTIIGFGKFIIIESKDNRLFDKDFHLILSKDDIEKVMDEKNSIDYFAFKFGNKWYYCDDHENVELKPLVYLGKEVDQFESPTPFLGVHGIYDLCNGSRDYSEWCKKAKFCNINTLGLTEENTLAGTLAFQNACEKAQIKSIIGETVRVKGSQGVYNIKLYVANQTGWKNLLLINSEINVFNEHFITEARLFELAEGLICVLTPDAEIATKVPLYKNIDFHSLYFQFDVSQWDSDEKDKKWLENTQNYFLTYYPSLKPVLIQDAYYLEKSDAKIRRDLNAIGKVSFKNQSRDQYFKTPNESLQQYEELFKPGDAKFEEALQVAMDSVNEIASVDFKIETGKLHLPLYEMTEDEKELYKDNVDLFWALIEMGLEEKIVEKVDNLDEYVARAEREAKVILDAKLQDYFLITWDILNWANKQGIMTGYGRGSAAGCLIAYLLGIVQTNPLMYDLLFERFLNEGRLYKKKKVMGWEFEDFDGHWFECEEFQDQADAMGLRFRQKEIEIKVTGSMPDIDNDIAGERREEVKRYIEQRYGSDRVAGIGTYGQLKMKSALGDLGRRSGIAQSYMIYLSACLPKGESDMSFTEFFKYAADGNPTVKKFIQEYPDVVEKIPLILNQPKTQSTHAAGVIIVPESEHGIYDQMPVKKMDGLLVSEWEMGYVEQAGFLKMDILGLQQLDKFSDILALIKEQTEDEFELKDIELDDPNVYKLFSGGYNEDVFQFQGAGLKSYTQDLMPETIEDLTATVALYRPGPIETGANMQYVNRKNGIETVTYPYGCEKILKDTYGNIVYQEQVMKIVEVLGGFTPNEADDVRKAMGKKDPVLMKTLKDKFVEGAYKNGVAKDESNWLWDQMETFAGYAFNKSHATCYAITGYHSQWLKANYPLQFWTISLKYSSVEQIPARLSEIYSTSNIRIAPPHINNSDATYTCDVKTNSIYWTISSIKQVGIEALKTILEEREKNGIFFSVEEFAKRMKPYGRSVKKNTIVNLILAGAFDDIHEVKAEKQRFSILQKYFTFRLEAMPEAIAKMKNWPEYRWIMIQRALSGLGNIDYPKLIKKTTVADKIHLYKGNREILEMEVENQRDILIGGLITKAEVKRSKNDKSKEFLSFEITDGLNVINGMLWDDVWEKYKKDLEKPEDKLVVITGVIKFDGRFKRSNVFYTNKLTKLVIIKED